MTQIAARTRRAARLLRGVTLAGIALIAAGCLGGAALLMQGETTAGALAVDIDATLPPVPGAALLLAVGALLVAALARLAAMLRQVEAGTAFPAAPLRGFARYLFLAVLASVLGPPLIQLGLGLAGHSARQVMFTLGGGEALMLFVTGLLFFVARLLDDAQAIADDASQIV